MKNINSRIGYIIVLTFWLVILMSLSTCSKKTHVITDKEPEKLMKVQIKTDQNHTLTVSQFLKQIDKLKVRIK
mgnify:CR=1 FL=1